MTTSKLITTLKIIITVLSLLILLSSGYLLLQLPRNLEADPFFRTLLVLFVVNLIGFVTLELTVYRLKKAQPTAPRTDQLAEKPHPHSKK